jgi:hypothetical protein
MATTWLADVPPTAPPKYVEYAMLDAPMLAVFTSVTKNWIGAPGAGAC